MLGMVALLFIFLLAVISIQMVLTPAEIQANASTTLTFFANKLVGQPLASLAILAFLSSTVATVQTTLLPSARTAFSMGRDGVLGRVWANVHPSFETPWLGTLILAVVAAVVAVLSLPIGGMSQIVVAGVTAIGILVAFYYGMAGIASAVYYRRAFRHSLKGFIFAGVFPVLSAIALFGLGGYFIYQQWTSTDSVAFSASNGKFVVIVPVLVILAAIPALVWSMLRARSNYYALPREAADARAFERSPTR
jgi:amino acid transporter